MFRRAVALLLVVGSGTGASLAAPRAELFDLKLGSTLAQLPPTLAFKDYACGSNGGPPGIPLRGFSDFRRCAPEPDGLIEVSFAYDDEAEYVARAHDDEPAGWQAGTAVDGFPIVASALFTSAGVLQGLRLVTDPRPDAKGDPFLHLRPHGEHYLLGLYLEDRWGLSEANCSQGEPSPDEGPVFGMFSDARCEKTVGQVSYTIETRFYRRPGETDVDPITGQPSLGSFVSETRAEMRALTPLVAATGRR